jgi:hypothetical protein
MKTRQKPGALGKTNADPVKYFAMLDIKIWAI